MPRQERVTQGECDCPDCAAGAAVDATDVFRRLLEDAAGLTELEYALDAEAAGAAFLAVLPADDVKLQAILNKIVPMVESRPGAGALALMRVLGSVACGVRPRVATVASAAADRMAKAGVSEPRWAAEVAEPVEVSDCARLHDGSGVLTFLSATFQRAGREHSFVVIVEQTHCGAAADIIVTGDQQLPGLTNSIRNSVLGGRTLGRQELTPAEFRWYAEDALDSRAVHDEEDPGGAPERFAEDGTGGPPYVVLAQLLRARLACLPKPTKPAGEHGHEERGTGLPALLEAFERLLGPSPAGFSVGFDDLGLGRPEVTLPAKRGKKDGPAPVYQLKVGLRGAKPPIWRRLLVPADFLLAELHEVIQVAFGWHGYHMHVFETPYGEFGTSDSDLGHRPDGSVTLEQVAQGANVKIRYTYDFGDDWEHEILVEKVLDGDPGMPALPWCTGGRRAAPPEDCGGIWGYADLLDALDDPTRADHEEKQEWLGLADLSEFDPAAFDIADVNEALTRVR